MTRRLVNRIGIRPLCKETQSFGTGLDRKFFVHGDRNHASGILLSAKPESAMRQATEHERRPFPSLQMVNQGGDGRPARFEA